MEFTALNKFYTIFGSIIHPLKQLHRSGNKKICPVTGLDISMQPGNSKFLSYSGVKWYYQHRHEVFKSLLETKLTETWKDKPLDKKFREIAHAVRNSDSNPRNNTKRKLDRILEDTNTLFDNYKLIDKGKLRKAGLL